MGDGIKVNIIQFPSREGKLVTSIRDVETHAIYYTVKLDSSEYPAVAEIIRQMAYDDAAAIAFNSGYQIVKVRGS